MKLQPVTPRTTAIGGKVGNVKWRYDPDEHADGMEVSPEVGRALVKSGHWTEVVQKPKKAPKPSFTQVMERTTHEAVKDDGIQE